MACFKAGIVVEGTWSRWLVGQASREAAERLHSNASVDAKRTVVVMGVTKRSTEPLRRHNAVTGLPLGTEVLHGRRQGD